MKLSQLTILFVAIFLIIVIRTDISIDNLTAVANVKSDMDYYMDQAMESAVTALIEDDAETRDESLNKGAAVESFFSSMYASLGILSDPKAQERFRTYVPVVAVTDWDGYYIMYSDVFTGNDGYSYVSHRWSEKMPYYYEDTNFLYRFTLNDNINILDKNCLLDPTGNNKLVSADVSSLRSDASYETLRVAVGSSSFLLNEDSFIEARQTTAITSMEKDLSWYVSKHNKVAARYGITYQFNMPVTSASEWAKAIEGPGFVVLFQGLPLVEGLTRTYNRMGFTGAGYRKEAVYYIEQPGWYYLYHKEGCHKIEGNLNIRDQKFNTIEEVTSLGCFACSDCDPLGVQAPSYVPVSTDNTNLIYSIKDWDDTKLGLIYDINNMHISTSGGNLVTKVTGGDPYFTIDYDLPDASIVDVVKVYARITGNNTSYSQFCFAAQGEYMSAERSCIQTINTDGKWQWIEFDVTANPYWRGNIKKLRFDIIGNSSSGGMIEINEIKLMGDREY